MSPDDHTPEDRRDESSDDQGHWLTSLLSALEWLDEASRSGRRRGDRTTIDYDVSIRTGDALDDRREVDRSPFAAGGDDRDRFERSEESDWNRPRTRRYRPDSSSGSPAPSSDHHLTTREGEDELLVTADVAGADPDDVTVGFDGATLVVGVDGRELDRIDVPWRERTAEATIKNGVLSVRVEPDSIPESDERPSTEIETETETTESATDAESETEDDDG
ncbi:Hsp20/alpha crystallin family protein [Haloterrigena sp. SYSU A558-1]|uniref:Hsp20/alpha crystallin family protein n=1 Tax=Haloterrigena gelatinilytica TaxID=2741724 RepID=A0ABX2L7Y5_9EURY|nr:Hsp20/alpha crystallin family protein [Haloterrigena gelatinilytica]NUC71458.1 Hsp20/alpha crystallin family protein [Haloterrigena gelatinilytica]